VGFGIVANSLPHPEFLLYALGTDRVGFWRVPNHVADVLVADPDLAQMQALLTEAKKHALEFSRYIWSSCFEVIHALGEGGVGTIILPERVVACHDKRELRPDSERETCLSKTSSASFADRVCCERPA
jgi:hypothetical protein